MDIHGASYFAQDGASVHTAKIVKKWFIENEIKTLEWPPQSPDLNPIENLWSFMKLKLRDTHCKNLAELEDAIKKLRCQDIKMDTFISHVQSMPRRLEQVIERKGGHTSY